MRFVHMADIHFDSPFKVLTDKKDFGTERRLEQRESFKKAINYISEQKIPFLFIAGDLYDQKYIRESTIEYINNLFKKIPDTKIFISPGNHDPFLKNSFYNTYNWNNNVTIFDDKVKTIELEDVDIYGYGFTDFYCVDSEIEKIEIENKDKINILITHGSLDASKTLDMQYNPINSSKLKEIGFDYVALGHIHKTNYLDNKNNFIYPGSLISFGFDELGEHGILDVEINENNFEKNKIINSEIKNNLQENKLNNKKIINNKIKINFIKLDDREFEEKNINISEINSEEELIEKMNSINLKNNNFYKLVLEGTKNIEINTNKLCKLIQNKNILKIKDRTKENYDIAKIATQTNLKGIFVKNMLNKLKEDNLSETQIKDVIEIGLRAFE